MNKKILFITIQIIIVLLTAAISPGVIASNQMSNQEQSSGLRIYRFNTTTELSLGKISNFSEPVSLNSSHSVDIYVSFNLETPHFFPKILIGTKLGNWIMFRDRNHRMAVDIELSLEKTPEWFEAELEDTKITIENITTETKTFETRINIKIDKDAPSLEKEIIELSAKFLPEKNWGFMASEDKINFTIIPEYIGSITAEFDLPENTTELILSTEQNMTILPVIIKNTGNGESIITIKIKDITENWNITLDAAEIILAKGQTQEVNVNIATPQTKQRQTTNLTVEISSKSTSETDIDKIYLQGQTIELSYIKLIKEDTTEKINFTTITLALIILLIFLAAIVFFFKKKK
jgi:hypothetical protein